MVCHLNGLCSRYKRFVLNQGFRILNNGYVTYNNQSMASIRATSSVGKPTAESTITIVTSPACGTPAAPMAAAVAVIL